MGKEGLYMQGKEIGFQMNLNDKELSKKAVFFASLYGRQPKLVNGENPKASYLTAYASGEVPTRF